MGIIQRQAAKASIISWMGVVFGLLNVLFVVPNVLEVYGIYTFIISLISLIVPVMTLGMQVGVVKFFNAYDDGSRSNRTFLLMGLYAVLIGFTVFLLFSFIFKEQLIDFWQEREPERYQYLVMVFPLVLAYGIFNIFTKYISNFGRIVVPNLLQNLIKFFLPFFLILYWYGYVGIWGFLYLVLGFNILLVVLLLIYMGHLGELDFRWESRIFTDERKGEIKRYLINGIFLSLGTVVAGYIDSVMLGSMIDIGDTIAIFSIGTVIAGVLILPKTAIASISMPIISKLWSQKDVAGIQSIYKKAGINLLVIGLFIFVGIWASIDDLFAIMKNGEVISKAKYVILYLGLARIFSLASSVNGMVLIQSPSYIVGTYALLFLAGMNIVTNYLFITRYGLMGAAMATTISVLAYNILIVTFLYYKYKLLPFSISEVPPFVFALVALYMTTMISFDSHIINIIVKSIIVSAIYLPLIYFTKISPDLNNMIDTNIRRGWTYINNK